MKHVVTGILALALAGCASNGVRQIETQVVKVREPVPCIPEGTRPEEVTPLKDRYSRAEWDALPTYERARLLSQNNIARVIYQNEAEVLLVACAEVPENPGSTPER